MRDLKAHRSDSAERSALFIVFEGIDGSGKSTQARMLHHWMKQSGKPALLTAEPSDGPIGRRIRSLKERAGPEEEAELFALDRRDHVERTIVPALRQGTTVICDRYVHSSIAYQGARGIDAQAIRARNNSFAIGPDTVFLLEVPVDTGLSRIASGRGPEFSLFEIRGELETVAAIYSDLEDPVIVRIDGTGPREQVHAQVVRYVEKLGRARE